MTRASPKRCGNCKSRPARRNRATCQRCVDRTVVNTRARRAAWRATRDKCVCCGRARLPTGKRCTTCSRTGVRYLARRRKAARESGMCAGCLHPKPDSIPGRCALCRDYELNYRVVARAI